MMRYDGAPCVAVVGPPNSGKTTLVNALDTALHCLPDGPASYLLDGSPDGTARYLQYSPSLRERLKRRVKGLWSETTATTICEWVDNCRQHLELVLVDLGGKITPATDMILERCSHFIPVVRADWRDELRPWMDACERAGLAHVATVWTLWEKGSPEVLGGASGTGLEVTFRSDASRPGESMNNTIVSALLDAILRVDRRSIRRTYFDLDLGRRWELDDLRDLGGRTRRLTALARVEANMLLGGWAPNWAYWSALDTVLRSNPTASVRIFDPKVRGGLVEIPDRRSVAEDSALARWLSATWIELPDKGVTLDLRVTSPDRFLPSTATTDLGGAPWPGDPPPKVPIVLSGRVPIWLHLTYFRWLWDAAPEREIGVWDASSRSAVFVRGPDAPRAVEWEFDNDLEETS